MSATTAADGVVLGRFRSDLRVVKRGLVRLAAAMSLFIGGAAIVGQLRFDRFPNFADLAYAFGIPLGAGAVLWAVCKLLYVLYPVKVLPGMLRAYDMAGIYSNVRWSEVTEVGRLEQYGLAYLTIRVKGRALPVTIPVWLEDLPAFARLVEAQAGPAHPLVEALKAELR